MTAITATAITALQKSEKVYYGESRVENFWLETPAANSKTSSVDYLTKLKQLFGSRTANSVICVFSDALSSASLGESLASARDGGSRVYILTNTFNDAMKNLDGCLMRWGGDKRIGSFVLINPNSSAPRGCLFTGQLSDGSLQLSDNLLLDLDKDQVSVLFRYFCYQFWNKAEKERIDGEERPVGAAPVDIFPPHEDSCDFQHLKTLWEKDAEGALVTASTINQNSYLPLTNLSGSNIVTLFSAVNNDNAPVLKQNGNTLIAFDSPCIINSVKTYDGVWLIPKIDVTPEEEVYALRLNDEQSNLLGGHIITQSQKNNRYEYFESELRKNLESKTLCRLGADLSQKYTIQAESVSKPQLPAPTALLCYDEFDKVKPEFADDGKSISINYAWTVMPFTLPAGSTKHPLYQNWDNEQNKISGRIEHIKALITENEKKESGLSKKILRFFQGTKQKFTEYRADLETLQQIKYSEIQKDELEKHINRIKAIHSFIAQSSSEIEEENRKAQIEEKIEAKQKDISQKENECAEKERELSEVQSAIEKQSGKKAEEAKKEVSDYKVKKQRLNNEIDKRKKEISSILNEINALKQQKNQPPVSKDKGQKQGSALSNLQGGDKKSPPTNSIGNLAVPALPHLPDKGKLYQHNGQDYLAIMYWEEYDEGVNEAKRFNAKLCAKGEKNG